MNFSLRPIGILGILSSLVLTLFQHAYVADAVEIDIQDAQSVRDAAASVAFDMMKYYTGNNTGDVPGNLPDPYYWWEAGAMFMSMVDYWYYTKDETYVAVTKQALLHQVGEENDYMPANQTKSEGNDDQLFWGLAAMTAAELKFSDPDNSHASWVAQAQAVFNEMAGRWDTASCQGGVRWQIYSFNGGWNYKNIISNGGLFQLSARLARYTGNETYQTWANKIWDWAEGTVLLDVDKWIVNDGTSTLSNCSQADQTQWTYNYGTLLVGSAFMYNVTESDKWKKRTEGLLESVWSRFFPDQMGPNIMVETTCEPSSLCDLDQSSFKAYLSRWLALTAQVVPSSYEDIMKRLRASAKGAAGQCSGSGHIADKTCGRQWNSTTWDGTMGIGEQMSALQVIGSVMLDLGNLDPPVTFATGGTSKADPNAGTGSSSSNSDGTYDISTPITGGDKAGASILTIFLILSTIGGAYWMMMGDF
ncbi:glycoside hydrolase family 76 protein [Aplosporella prunicola CBS 121167]|uniref:Mannan endo-1,6-alpha-mannosidase n=1 Tax=Aplosporella prunicola CBS 121167 TaxID=1176127 RepID=A0A6A6B2W1_9PEZI|nr:glycoside hydrolase family 76 protein [Aplosporella prunicola CBS 121167]KAF2137585.1 glycoside hydrolase family 76 protein [Aplosporella prunicola CBS 121167]